MVRGEVVRESVERALAGEPPVAHGDSGAQRQWHTAVVVPDARS